MLDYSSNTTILLSFIFSFIVAVVLHRIFRAPSDSNPEIQPNSPHKTPERKKKPVHEERVAASTHPIETPSEQEVEILEARKHWGTGTNVEVYSFSGNSWCPGTILSVMHDEEGEWLTVLYEVKKEGRTVRRTKESQRCNDDIREARENASQKAPKRKVRTMFGNGLVQKIRADGIYEVELLNLGAGARGFFHQSELERWSVEHHRRKQARRDMARRLKKLHKKNPKALAMGSTELDADGRLKPGCGSPTGLDKSFGFGEDAGKIDFDAFLEDDGAGKVCFDDEMDEELPPLSLEDNTTVIGLPRDQWKKGTQIEVYSECSKCWNLGEVEDISHDEEGEWLTVTYVFVDTSGETSKRTKETQRFYDDVRPVQVDDNADCDLSLQSRSVEELQEMLSQIEIEFAKTVPHSSPSMVYTLE